MINTYILYSEAQKKIDNSNIPKLYGKAKKEYNLPQLGLVSDDSYPEMMHEMKQEGFFEKHPEMEKQLKKAAKNYHELKWRTKREDKIKEEDTEDEEFAVTSGYFGSYIISPSELDNYRKYGFSSPLEFLVLAGAYAQNNEFTLYKGYEWKALHSDKRIFTNMVSGNMHADMAIIQTNITPYETTDPFGNKALYRPAYFNSDMSFIQAYHSTEISLLTKILRHVEHSDTNPDNFKKKLPEILRWLSQFSEGNPIATSSIDCETYGPQGDFIALKDPLPDISEQGNLMGENMLPAMDREPYFVFTNKEKELLIATKEDKDELKIKARFLLGEMEDLTKSLLYQSLRCIGRTHISILVRCLEYWRSEEYYKDEKEMESFRKSNAKKK